MLKITKKTDYGLTLMAVLAKDPAKLHSLHHISQNYNLPYKFIGQIAADLLEAGIVVSKEGASGGYKLAKPPEKITLLELIEILDGAPVKVDCLNGKVCSRQSTCAHHHLIAGIAEAIKDSLSQKSLADLVKV